MRPRHLASIAAVVVSISTRHSIDAQIPTVGVKQGVKKQLTRTPTIDGKLDAAEWPVSGTLAIQYLYGWMLLRTDTANLYVALDVTADDVDEGVWSFGTAGDLFELMVDINGDKVLNVNDVSYSIMPGNPNLPRLSPGAFVKASAKSAGTAARVAAGFGPTPRGSAAHRVWEMSIPIVELTSRKAESIGLAARVSSSKPPFSALGPFPDTLLVIDIVRGSPTTLRLPSAPVKSAVAADGGGAIRRTILPGGGVELAFPDGTRKQYLGGTTITIFPDGRRSMVSAMSVARATPPSLPSEPGVLTWIELEAADLLETIQQLVGGDAASVANYTESEKGLSIYKKVDKRIRCIFYLLAAR
jgi:hypothetical protein